MKFAKPNQVPTCVCRDTPNPMAATFCPYGHMTECHYPLDCGQASCSHVTRYEEVDPADFAAREELTLSFLQRISEPHCDSCRGSGTIEISETVELPPGILPAGHDNKATFTSLAVCSCISAASAT